MESADVAVESAGATYATPGVIRAFPEVGADVSIAMLSVVSATSVFAVSASAERQHARATDVAAQCLNAMKW